MMNKLYTFALVITISFLPACAPQQSTSNKHHFHATYKTTNIQLPASPQKIVPLTSSLFHMLYAVKGSAIARPSTNNPLPVSALTLPEIGQASHINTEILVTLQPDFVLGLKSQNQKIAPILDANHIPYLLIDYDGIDDNVPILKFLGELTNNQSYANEVIQNYQDAMKDAQSRAQKYTPARVIVLRATGKDITAEMPTAIASSMVEKLGMHNIVSEFPSLPQNTKTVPFSLESLTASNPDIIFIVTMGKIEQIQEKLNSDLTTNPAWQGLSAVKKHRVYYLPSDLFLLNPGLRTPEAMNMLITLAYTNK